MLGARSAEKFLNFACFVRAAQKFFGVLHDCFRHGIEKHKICFEAVCVIVQYQLESGPGLFDV